MFDGDGTLGAVAYTGTQAIAHYLAHQNGFAVNQLQGTLVAAGNAQSATVALVAVNGNNISCPFHKMLFLTPNT